ncbi:hypothetical protein ACFC08_17900 [Streptomyces sp. NPDC056112]|uniref:hypothetical protein n=1 Tax=Streptomyces sp. NPDC056112 TaxID=3345715 RepID=UPI0035DFC7AF
MSRRPLQWMPDELSARILGAYRLRRESVPSVIGRALRMLARADGLLDGRGRIVTDRQREGGQP